MQTGGRHCTCTCVISIRIPSERFWCPSKPRFSRPAVSLIRSCCKRRFVSTSGTFFLVTCKIPMLGNLEEESSVCVCVCVCVRERGKELEEGER